MIQKEIFHNKMYFTITWAARRLNPYLYPYPFFIYSKTGIVNTYNLCQGTFIVFRNTVVPMHMANCRYWSINVLECSPSNHWLWGQTFRYLLQCLQVFTGKTELHLLTELPGLHDLIDFFLSCFIFFHPSTSFLLDKGIPTQMIGI